MPELYMHRQFGEHMLNMTESLNVDKEIFMWAQEGPDFWAYLKPRIHENRSQTMHTCKAEDFVDYLVNTYSNDKSVFSYAMGFFCHMIYDEMAHPFIEYRSNDTNAPWYCGGHMTLERALDVQKMKAHGDSIWCLCKVWPIGKAKELRQSLDKAYLEVYGWKHAYSKMRIAYFLRFFFYLIFWDPLGLIYHIGHLLKSERIQAFSYQGKEFSNIDIENNNHNYWGEFDWSFEEITENAINLATEKIIMYNRSVQSTVLGSI